MGESLVFIVMKSIIKKEKIVKIFVYKVYIIFCSSKYINLKEVDCYISLYDIFM